MLSLTPEAVSARSIPLQHPPHHAYLNPLLRSTLYARTARCRTRSCRHFPRRLTSLTSSALSKPEAAVRVARTVAEHSQRSPPQHSRQPGLPTIRRQPGSPTLSRQPGSPTPSRQPGSPTLSRQTGTSRTHRSTLNLNTPLHHSQRPTWSAYCNANQTA